MLVPPRETAALLVLMLPPREIPLGAVAVRPPANVKVSAAPLPKNSAPEVPKVVALVILVVLPCSLSAKLPAVFVIAVA